MSNKMPDLSTMKAPISQLTVEDNYYMFDWRAHSIYDSCHALKDYMQVSSNTRRYLRTIQLQGSIRLN